MNDFAFFQNSTYCITDVHLSEVDEQLWMCIGV